MRRMIVLVAWLAASAGPAVAGACNPATDWMAEAKVGAFMHFLPGEGTFGLVDRFDVGCVAGQLAGAGARYFVFTLGQNSGYMNAPNATYERLAGMAPNARCAKRDLPMELAAALKPHGIRLMLYLPCQTPNRDVQAVRAFGVPAEPLNKDRKIDLAFAHKWAQVIQEWSDRYGDSVSGWWFDGGYQRVGFNDEIAAVYARAAKHGNPKAVVTFNPGVSLKRWAAAEDYTAGELNEPFAAACEGRWLEGSQWQVLTYLGRTWGKRDTRFGDGQWASWVAAVTSKGGCVTVDLGPNYDAAAGPVGAFAEEQLRQLKAIAQAARR